MRRQHGSQATLRTIAIRMPGFALLPQQMLGQAEAGDLLQSATPHSLPCSDDGYSLKESPEITAELDFLRILDSESTEAVVTTMSACRHFRQNLRSCREALVQSACAISNLQTVACAIALKRVDE